MGYYLYLCIGLQKKSAVYYYSNYYYYYYCSYAIQHFEIVPLSLFLSHLKTCEPNLESIMRTHIHAKTIMHTDYRYLFIYHVCMYAFNEVCV